MRTPLHRHVDLPRLSAELSAELGRPVALSARMPGDSGAPGVLVLLDPVTGDPLPDQDPKKVKRVLDGHAFSPPEEVKTPAEVLVEALQGSSTAPEVRDALIVYATAMADRGRRRTSALRLGA